jgi:hypothetical protein
MIKHIVCWKLVNRTEPLGQCEDALAIKKVLEDLPGKIPGLIKAEVGINTSGADSAHDVVLYSELESKEALATYQTHPAHVEAGQTVRPRTQDRIMVDYEV